MSTTTQVVRASQLESLVSAKAMSLRDVLVNYPRTKHKTFKLVGDKSVYFWISKQNHDEGLGTYIEALKVCYRHNILLKTHLRIQSREEIQSVELQEFTKAAYQAIINLKTNQSDPTMLGYFEYWFQDLYDMKILETTHRVIRDEHGNLNKDPEYTPITKELDISEINELSAFYKKGLTPTVQNIVAQITRHNNDQRGNLLAMIEPGNSGFLVEWTLAGVDTSANSIHPE